MWMAEARRVEDWTRMAIPTAILANANRDAKKHPRPYRPDDFNPWATPIRKRPSGPEEWQMMRQAMEAKHKKGTDG
jgi:hypothetical protein